MQKKQFLLIILVFMLIIHIFFPVYIYADEETTEIDVSLQEIEEISQINTNILDEPSINSKNAIIYDRETKQIIFGKNENQRTAMASTTKIMTCIIVLENGNLNDIITVSKKSANTRGSRLGLHTNDKITINDLLYGLMLCSGNDAAVALAEYVSGSIENFAILMNEKASSLGLIDTHFVTPHGLDNEEHYTTAYELAIITDYALNNPTFAKIVNTKNYTITINGYSKTLSNTNELLGSLNGVNGVKTGFTGNAGRCLVTSCNRNNFNIITVVIGADTKKIRTTDSIHLIDYAYKNFEKINLKSIVQKDFENWVHNNLDRIIIDKSSSPLHLTLENCENYSVIVKKLNNHDIHTIIHSNYHMEAPISQNTQIGTLDVMDNDNIIFSINIVASNTVYKKTFTDYYKNFLSNFPYYFKIDV